MKTFKASDLSHKRAEAMKAARDGGALIQEKRTNGEVIQEYVLITNDELWRCTRSTVQDIKDMSEA